MYKVHSLKIISYTTHRTLLDFAQAHSLPYKCKKVENSFKKCAADNATHGSFRHFSTQTVKQVGLILN